MRRFEYLFKGLLNIAEQFGSVVATTVETRLLVLRDALRIEVRHAGFLLALAIVLGACVVIALVCAAAAILMACWDSHRVLATALIGAGFSCLALGLILVMRR